MSGCGCYDPVVFGHACKPPAPAPAEPTEPDQCPCDGCMTRRG